MQAIASVTTFAGQSTNFTAKQYLANSKHLLERASFFL